MVKTKDRTREKSGRAAWKFEAPPAPTLSDLRAGGERRKAWVKYHLTDNVQNVLDLATHFGLKLIPIEACSAIGARLARFAVPRWHKVALQRARANIRELKPDWSDAEVEAAVWRNFDNQGRLMTEFSVLEELVPKGRVTFHNTEPAQAAAAAGPVILLALHLGNWEVLAPGIVALGIHPTDNHVPPKQRARAWIANRVRERIGIRFLPAGVEAIRPAIKILKAGGAISIFGDEGFQKKIMAPFFHREPHLEGNLAIAVRLARHTGATIVPGYVLRTRGCRFELHGITPITLPPTDDPAGRLREDVMMLNDAIEPVILAHLDQWYFIDNRLH
ncbi:lysophospholipid acyltransferase family protein [Methylobrevis albus]|uniref:Lipid A biosynthesis lauroyl acyltransferase n=1 Tax=Methylobrevis albus TaxID=2793297 RepID=A0A931MYB5_9HYPH|nr:lipid A biosynthesis lauroyl acyltransferase [Methylobrevis albus]MBH0236546.1 lipid A biosynthesis lauroyl acyltransferase [Methylobrevis albus]